MQGMKTPTATEFSCTLVAAMVCILHRAVLLCAASDPHWYIQIILLYDFCSEILKVVYLKW